MSTATTPTSTGWDKLTPKQKRQHEQFCIEYIIDFNGARAARDAGFSKKTAKEQAHRLLTHAHIQARVTELTKERQARAKKNGDDVIAELERVGFSRVNHIVSFNESGMVFVQNSEDIEDDDAAAIESVKVTEIVSKTEDGNDMLKTEIKLHAKVPALTLLAKHHKLIPDRHEHTGKDGESLPQGITINFVPAKRN